MGRWIEGWIVKRGRGLDVCILHGILERWDARFRYTRMTGCVRYVR